MEKIHMKSSVTQNKIDEKVYRLKERTLVLVQTDSNRDVVFNAWKQNGLNAAVIFKDQPSIIRMIRRFWANYFLPGYSLWYGNWKKELDRYDTVIVHADVRTRTVPRFIHKIKPAMRIIYWYWNPVNKDSLPELTKDRNIECWSFDVLDCKKYGMKRNIQYYYEQDSISGLSNGSGTDYDLYFVGHDKGRKAILENIKNEMDRFCISYKFDIFDDGNKGIPYEEVKYRIKKTKAILEINQEGQVGCTLRALEALFFKKKLVTTNKKIISEDFYNSNNIFIYGVDDLKNINEFLKLPYDESSDLYRNMHTIDTWFLNFFVV